MSVQTGVAPASGPVSQRLVDRARFRVDRLRSEPNPIWIRELKQAARLVRTPIILTALSILMTLLMASIGGILSTSKSPAQTGVVLFQVFFSVAYFVVTLIGPAVAANSIASEREGRTWEAVILTGLRPGIVARGKFLAAFTAIGMYIVMLAPVGALPFLFGGVTAVEVIVAFIFLFLVALLSVAFGLAISSKMASLRAAILITLLLAFPLSILAFLAFGVGLSAAAHDAWSGVVEGAPIWLPTAFERAPFGLDYVVFLFLLPLAAVALPAWFLYEVTIANLTSITDDQSTGLKRWFVVAVPVITLAAGIPMVSARPTNQGEVLIVGMSAFYVFLGFSVFLFAGDPIGPSRRVQMHWDAIRASRLRRFLGPGIMRSASLTLIFGLGAILALTLFGVLFINMVGTPDKDTQIAQVCAFAEYAAAFYVFVVGLATWIRARSMSALSTRVLLFAVLFGVAIGPWIVAAIAGLIADGVSGDDALLVASPSPFYAYVVVDALDEANPDTQVLAGIVCSIGWVVLGFALLALARTKSAKIIAAHEAVRTHAESLLAQEDITIAAAEAEAERLRGAPPPEAAGAEMEGPPAIRPGSGEQATAVVLPPEPAAPEPAASPAPDGSGPPPPAGGSGG